MDLQLCLVPLQLRWPWQQLRHGVMAWLSMARHTYHVTRCLEVPSHGWFHPIVQAACWQDCGIASQCPRGVRLDMVVLPSLQCIFLDVTASGQTVFNSY